MGNDLRFETKTMDMVIISSQYEALKKLSKENTDLLDAILFLKNELYKKDHPLELVIGERI